MLFTGMSFAAGVVFTHGYWRPASTFAIACAAMLALALLATLRAPRLALTCTLLAWYMLGCTCGSLHPRPVPSRALQRYEDGLRRDVLGNVTHVEQLASTGAEPQIDQDPLYPGELAAARQSRISEDIQSVDIALQSVEELTPDISRMQPAHGSIRLTVYAPRGHMPLLPCGATVRITTRLHPPQQFRDPGVWQREQYLAEAGVIAVGSSNAMDIRFVQAGAAPPACRIAAMRTWAAGRLVAFAQWQGAMPLPRPARWTAQDAAVLSAMLFGDRTSLTHNLRLQFERTGTFHLFVVAGMHVALMAAAAYWLLRRLRAPGWLATCAALGLTGLYALFTGFGEPVQRALLMTAVYMAARLLARERSVLNAVGAAALVMLAARPQACFDAGFQMTVLIALAIGGVALPILQRTTAPYVRACRRIRLLRLDQHAPPRIAQFRVGLRTFGEGLAALFGKRVLPVPAFAVGVCLRLVELTILALTTEVVMAVPMAVWFHRVTPLALPANLLVVPFLPIVMVCALATFALACLSHWAALVPGVITALALHAVSFVVRGVGGLRSADWRIPSPPAAVIAAVLLALCVAGVLLRRFGRRPAWLGVALLPAAMAALLVPYPAEVHKGVLEITAIDVGQGDSILMTGPEGATMLIDAGGQVGPETAAPRGNFDMGDDVVSPYLWSRGIRTLDILVLTHAHMDHIGGMDAVLRNFRPRELWLSVEPDSQVLRNLLAEARARGVVVRHLHGGDSAAWSGTSLHVLSPAVDYRAKQLPTNDDSLVLRVDFGKASALLEGDAERPSEQRMLSGNVLTPATLLQVGHHGSDTSTTDALVAAVRPHAAVISCGRGNRFGHPRAMVLQRLQSAGVLTSRTDTMGATQYLLKSDGSIVTHVLASNLQ